ncbi:MAG: hypothetical protein RLZZ214_3234 [Verrucomicrobiota bacterium]|jgi:hypothetical protein
MSLSELSDLSPLDLSERGAPARVSEVPAWFLGVVCQRQEILRQFVGKGSWRVFGGILCGRDPDGNSSFFEFTQVGIS